MDQHHMAATAALVPNLDVVENNGLCDKDAIGPKRGICATAAPPQPTTAAEDSYKLTGHEWNPDAAKFRGRYIHRLKLLGSLPDELKTLPEGFPAHVDTPLAWTGDDLKEKEYLVHLTTEDVAEVNKALSGLKAQGVTNLQDINKSNFVLPKLGDKIALWADKLYNCRGFFVIRGLNPKDYDAKDNMMVYVGVSSYVAEQRGKQDERGNYFLHLQDVGAQAAPDSIRQAPYSNVQQPFHTDAGDIISMYTIQPALKGGRSLLSSSAYLYNILAELRKDLVQVLAAKAWPYDHFNRDNVPYHLRTLLDNTSLRNPIPILNFARRPLIGSPVSPRTAGIPGLTDAQEDALDSIHYISANNAIAIQQKAGDLIFWNNMALTHARESFQDGPEGKRHLVRMWLRDPARAWDVPEMCKETFDEAFEYAGAQLWPVAPITDFEHITTNVRSCGHA